MAIDRQTGQKVAIKVVRKYELNTNQVSFAKQRAQFQISSMQLLGPHKLLRKSCRCRGLWPRPRCWQEPHAEGSFGRSHRHQLPATCMRASHVISLVQYVASFNRHHTATKGSLGPAHLVSSIHLCGELKTDDLLLSSATSPLRSFIATGPT